MSPIGRIFIVLNLALAGAFVYFAGVYLEQSSDWRTKHDTVQADLNNQLTQLRGQLEDAANRERDSARKLEASERAKGALETENQTLTAEKEQLARQLNTIQSELQSQASSLTTIASTVETTARDTQTWTEKAIAATAERDQAVREMEVAKADLRDRENQIAQLQEQITQGGQSLAALEQQLKEANVKLEIVASRYPGLLGVLQPDLRGTVTRVEGQGKLATIQVTHDPADAGVKPGYSFAIYSGSNYKGEAIVTTVDGNFAFCRITKTTGSPIEEGDQATTVTNS